MLAKTEVLRRLNAKEEAFKKQLPVSQGKKKIQALKIEETMQTVQELNRAMLSQNLSDRMTS